MPSYVDFNASKKFRDFILAKTLPSPNGPQTFSSENYAIHNLSTMSNVDPGAVDTNRQNDLLRTQNSNIFKPTEYFINENINTIPRKANLELYPYFVKGQHHSFVSIMSSKNYETESELMKFAAWNIKDNPEGPVFSRIAQNLYSATVGRVRLIDALDGNIATATNLVTGREPLIEFNSKITVAKTLPGKTIDFLQTVSGVEFPWAEIPGDYLTNPQNPINPRPSTRSEAVSIYQDATGVLGSLIGIQRRPISSRKPSDLLIEYTGSRQLSILYDNLSYSKYAPNYTTTARSQNTSKLFNFIDNVGQNIKNALGVEAPAGIAYIGDDRGNDVKFAMNDFNDRPVRSGYYLSLMFDPIQARLFQRTKNIGEGGSISGNLTWYTTKSRNRLGVGNDEYNTQGSQFEDSLSTNYKFKDGSILGITQEILETMPLEGGPARSHIANVIDQTSRVFMDGDVKMSKGSAIRYIDQFTNSESGIEYCRVWTKDRSYMNYSDTMKRTGNYRKLKSGVLTRPWNLNIYPNSNGNGSFDTTSEQWGKSIGAQGFYAKKYMFSIENLAWKMSDTPGFTYSDLPYCERGPNGGRIMWFPPYGLTVNEQNSANWTDNVFLGRPEPVYTYSNTQRSGQVQFKVVVDHPSILNLLTQKHFKNMSNDEADNYINAFFAGCKDFDLYDLVRNYPTLTPDELETIMAYLNQNKDPKTVLRNKSVFNEIVSDVPTPVKEAEIKPKENIMGNFVLYYKNDFPKPNANVLPGLLYTPSTYNELYDNYIGSKDKYIKDLNDGLRFLTGKTTWGMNEKHDFSVLSRGIEVTQKPTDDVLNELVLEVNNDIEKGFSVLQDNYSSYCQYLDNVKTQLLDNTIDSFEILLKSRTSPIANSDYNLRLAYRRSYSIIKDIIKKLINDGTDVNVAIDAVQWKINVTNQVIETERDIILSFKEHLGYPNDGRLVFSLIINQGEQNIDDNTLDCSDAKLLLTSSQLKETAPSTFWCRQTHVAMGYVKREQLTTSVDEIKSQDLAISQPTTLMTERKLVEVEHDVPTGNKQRPPIDAIKSLIMKSLSECYYFKQLEEESPLQFSSLREKLRYFHPTFHSMTPEGLNARLTFLQQCVRPGDTLPIRGISDESDLNARNTTFGPPPVCILRIGDFYHSKIIIRDVNISFEENIWDLNPEGIGVQPMIADVTLMISFIGGQGLERPVERLQNALSSNFYANTEMYDPRSISTEDRTEFYKQEFSKEFLDELSRNAGISVKPDPLDKITDTNLLTEGQYIGTLSDMSLDYTEIIDGLYDAITNYFNRYQNVYNIITTKYGHKLSSIFLSPTYRQIFQYEVQTGNGIDSFEMLGNYPKNKELDVITLDFITTFDNQISGENISNILGLHKDMPGSLLERTEMIIKPYIINNIKNFVETMVSDTKSILSLEESRNRIIMLLDKLNFILKHQQDAKKVDNKFMGAILNVGDVSEIYYEYQNLIYFIQNQQHKFTEDLDISYDFRSKTMTTNDVSYFLSIFLRERKNEIMKLFDSNSVFTDKIKENIDKRLDKFFLKMPKEKNFKIPEYPIRVNGNNILYKINDEVEINDTSIQQELILVNKTRKNDVESILNYYRPSFGLSG